MWPRQLLGYGRLEQERLLGPINALYQQAWGPLQNFFLPSMKLVKKWREGSRWVRRHDEPQTAYQRLMAHGELRAKARRQLRERYEALDPFVLGARSGTAFEIDSECGSDAIRTARHRSMLCARLRNGLASPSAQHLPRFGV